MAANHGVVSPGSRYLIVFFTVPRPVANATSKRAYGHTSQVVCPWNVKVATELKEPVPTAMILHGQQASIIVYVWIYNRH